MEEKVGNNDVLDKKEIWNLMKEKDITKVKKGLEKYKNNPNYQFLFDCICSLFAELLKIGLDNLYKCWKT